MKTDNKPQWGFNVNVKPTDNANCDGSGPHAPGEVRVYPLGGGGNLILCLNCWAKENRYRFERGRETGAPENWPQLNFWKAEVYAP